MESGQEGFFPPDPGSLSAAIDDEPDPEDMPKWKEGWHDPKTNDLVNYAMLISGFDHRRALRLCTEAAQFFAEGLR